MPLEPAAEAGLWVDPDRPINGPGVHALIIGVSRYDHLAEGAAPAPETYGLGQLSVSALTAYRFFAWLEKGYALERWPVARVRLLMSPLRQGVGKATADELEGCHAAICAHAPEATFDNCRRALENWYADMEALQAPASGRSLFFFSGHGLEKRQNYQVLLPSDYLRPPARPVNSAISTPNLADALSYLARVSSHVLLLDGCRNDIEKLRGVTGTRILNDEQPITVNPLFEKGALYATASGLRAYSPKFGGLSLFGQALLDGLRNKPEPVLDEAPIELIRKGPVSAVEINKLGSYMKGRVAALIKSAQESVVQVVRSEVASSDPGQPIELAEIAAAPAVGRSIVEEVVLDLESHSMGAAREVGATEPTSDPDAWFRERYQPEQPAVPAPAGAGLLEQESRLHAMFGSEAITIPWLSTLRIIGLSTRRSADYRAVEILYWAQAPRTSALHRLQVHVRLVSDDPIGHLMFVEAFSGRRFCCVLPHDLVRRVFQLEIDVEDGDFINLSAYLSPHNDTPTGRIAAAWEQLRARDPLAATQRLEESNTQAQLEEAFRESEQTLGLKLQAPLAAAVATVLLLKGNQFDRMHDWARNLANWFPALPDGVVLWTEQCRRLAARKPLEPDLIPWFVREMSRRSLPFTADAFGLAADLVRDIVRRRLATDDATRAAAGALEQRIEAVAPYFRDSGLFCSFSGFPASWDAPPLLGPPAASPPPASGRVADG